MQRSTNRTVTFGALIKAPAIGLLKDERASGLRFFSRLMSILCGLLLVVPVGAGWAATASKIDRLKMDNNLRMNDMVVSAEAVDAATDSTPMGSANRMPTLAALVARAEAHDPNYRAAQAGLLGAREYETIGRASVLPVVRASGSRSRNRQDREIRQGSQRLEDRRFYDSTSATVQLRQPIYAPEAVARYKEALAVVDEAEVAFADEYAQMVIRVVDAYLNAVFSAQRASVLRQSVNDLDALLKSAERRFEYGDSTRSEVLDLTARLQRAKAQSRSADNEHRTAVARLASLTGSLSTEVLALIEDVGNPLQLSRGSIEGWSRVAYRSSTQRLTSEAKIAQAEAALLRAKGAGRPRVDALASFSLNDSDTVNTVGQEFETGSLGLQVSVPIFSSGSDRASVRQAKAFLRQAREELSAVELELDRSVRDAYDSFISAIEQERALIAVKRSAAVSAEVAARGYEAGVQSLLDVVVAKGLERDVALEALQIRYETARAFVVLHNLAGQVDDELINALSNAFSGRGS